MYKTRLKINFHLLRLIIKFSKILYGLNTKNVNGLTLNKYRDIEERSQSYREHHAKARNKFYKILNKFHKYDLQRIYTLYYYGRDHMEETTSYYDLLIDNNNLSKNEFVKHFLKKPYSSIKIAINRGKSKFYNHEKNIRSKKLAFERRLSKINRDSLNDIEKYKDNMNKSTFCTFKHLFDEYEVKRIEDIQIATKFLMQIIHATGGALVVDFLGYNSFDHLDYVECDKEHKIIKLYWKYSNVNCILPPHNQRVDIKFDSLSLYHKENTIGVALKGYYQSLKDVKNYFSNFENISKFIRKPLKYEKSHFHFETEFDKVVLNKKQECFKVSILPWRFYNILISPKENIGSTLDSINTLHKINISEIEDRLEKTFNKFNNDLIESEDDLTMYGNRYRKIIENILKLICLAKGFMFDKNYKDDTIGRLLMKLKQNSIFYSEITEDNLYDKNIVSEIFLNSIIEISEGISGYLNLLSHENVCTKIEKDIIIELHDKISRITVILSHYLIN